MKKRIGILTGGGDCPGLNAVIRAATRSAILQHGWDVVGIEDGYQGLYERRVTPLTINEVRGIITRGGTVIGSSNRANPFKYPVRMPDGTEEVRDVSKEIMASIRDLGLDAIIAIGGDGTMLMSQGLVELGAKIVGVPKTIDNDLRATDVTFGFQTAVEIATEAIDRLHTTAESHDRIILCEVMGRYAGWIALHAGVASGAHVILIPEMPYKLERIVDFIKARKTAGKSYSIVVVAEGALPASGDHAVAIKGDETMQDRLGGAADRLARELVKPFGEHDVRVTVLGHVQRGGTPCAFDRVLATRFGAHAVTMVAEDKIGHVASLRGTTITSAPIKEACAKLKLVDPSGPIASAARQIGIELGA